MVSSLLIFVLHKFFALRGLVARAKKLRFEKKRRFDTI